MKKEQYFYNPATLRYEKVEATKKAIFLRIAGFLCATLVFASVIVFCAYTFIDSPKEKRLKREISQLAQQYNLMDKEIAQMDMALQGLRYRDGNIYRSIFETDPIPNEIWNAGIGGAKKYRDLENFDNSDLMIEVAEKVDKINRQLYIQSKSYDEIAKMVENKADMLASIPSIQPIRNKDLTRIASGFGMRIDPIYKVRRMHKGMDFTAPTGTEIYATGKGKIEVTKHSRKGYGNHVIIDHGYGYKTLYAHMSKIKSKKGDEVKRGDVIGYVGNTGKSVGPHLHYEVIKDRVKVNPVHFFHNDLNDEQYEKMLLISAQEGQSLD